MVRLRRILLALLGLAGVLSLVAATLAILGHARWGGAWWYFPAGPDYRLRCGQEALYRGDLAKVDQVVQRLEADGFPDHAHFLRGHSYLRQLRFDGAVGELNQIRADNEPIRIQAGVIFGLGFWSQNRLREAEHLLYYVVSKDPDNLEAHRGLATIYFDQGAKGLAVIHAREWVRLAPEDGNAWRFLGIIYSDFGDSNSWAADAFRHALGRNLGPEATEEVKLELAEVLAKQSESYGEALRVLDELDPEHARTQRALELRAECLWGLGRSADLPPLLDEGQRLYPNSTALLRTRALLSLYDNPQAAVAPLELAVRIDPQDRTSRFQLAQAYELLGRRAEASEQRRIHGESQKALEEMSELSKQLLDKPWDREIRLRLAAICEKLDKPAEAAMWRKAADNCPPAAAGERKSKEPGASVPAK
jgi:predicted Zn-dependent protease